jgi:hypothetical protein
MGLKFHPKNFEILKFEAFPFVSEAATLPALLARANPQRGKRFFIRKSGVLFLIGPGVLSASHCQAVVVPSLLGAPRYDNKAQKQPLYPLKFQAAKARCQATKVPGH